MMPILGGGIIFQGIKIDKMFLEQINGIEQL